MATVDDAVQSQARNIEQSIARSIGGGATTAPIMGTALLTHPQDVSRR